MSTFSFEEFILSQIHIFLKSHKYTFSTWERVVEKSSSWMCYIYNDKIFIGKLYMHFICNEDQSKLVPYDVNVVFHTYTQRIINNWNEIFDNEKYKYSQQFNLNNADSLKIISYQLLPLLVPKKSGIMSFFDGSIFTAKTV